MNDDSFPAPEGLKPRTPRTEYDPASAARSQRRLERMAENALGMFECMPEWERQKLIGGVLQECPHKWRKWLNRLSPGRLVEVQVMAVLGLCVVVRTRTEAMRQPETPPDPEANHG